MTDILSIINFAMVFIFGLVLTAAFSGALYNRRHRIGLIVFYLLVFIVQIFIFLALGANFLKMLYPLITHIPLLIFLVFYCEKKWTTAVISLASAYLMTSPRHWFGSLTAALFGGSASAFYLTQILITVPMLFLILRFVAPYLRPVIGDEGKGPWIFSAFLIMYYFSTYALTVYTDAIYLGNPAVIEFVNSAVVIYYFAFILIYYREIKNRTIAENYLKIHEVKLEQTRVYIDQIKQSQKQIAIVRHDLRHHLDCINLYIRDNKIDNAKKYINSIKKSIADTAIINYCSNDTVNMILIFYVKKARVAGISCIVNANVPDNLSIPEVDLCVIIANAMENAISACLTIPENEKSDITINAHTKNGLLFFEVLNPYYGEIIFEDGIPVTNVEGHGFGTKSIVITTEKLNGIWSFDTKDGFFTMRVVL